MHYKGTGKVHSFRGLLADGKQRKIRIQGSVGAIAWRITKLQIISYNMNEDAEHIVQVFREQQSSVSNVYNFDDDELLGAAFLRVNKTAPGTNISTIVFDNTLFVRNIWITQDDVGGSSVSCNYYIELEEVKVSTAGMAQLAVAAARRTRPPVA
jgi:hypothetical protein